MYTRLNSNARKHFVGHQTNSGVEMYFSTPFNKSSATHLTLRTSSGERIDLKGHDVNSLMKVLNTGTTLRKKTKNRIVRKNKVSNKNR